MDEKSKVVMIDDQDGPAEALKRVFRRLGMEVYDVHTCQETSLPLKRPG